MNGLAAMKQIADQEEAATASDNKACGSVWRLTGEQKAEVASCSNVGLEEAGSDSKANNGSARRGCSNGVDEGWDVRHNGKQAMALLERGADVVMKKAGWVWLAAATSSTNKQEQHWAKWLWRAGGRRKQRALERSREKRKWRQDYYRQHRNPLASAFDVGSVAVRWLCDRQRATLLIVCAVSSGGGWPAFWFHGSGDGERGRVERREERGERMERREIK